MCGCSDNEGGKALFEALLERQKFAEEHRFTHTITVGLCDGTNVAGKIDEITDSYVVLQVSATRGVSINEFVRYCCICKANEFNANG